MEPRREERCTPRPAGSVQRTTSDVESIWYLGKTLKIVHRPARRQHRIQCPTRARILMLPQYPDGSLSSSTGHLLTDSSHQPHTACAPARPASQASEPSSLCTASVSETDPGLPQR